MDEVLRYLSEAEYYINSYEDISLADSFFESEENEKNEEAGNGAVNALKKAFGHLIEVVKTIIKSIKDFFESKFLSADEKRRYKEFKAMVKSDPNLKNTKVFVEDFREYERVYDEALKKLEEESKKPTFNNEVVEAIEKACLESLKKLNDKYGDVAKRAAHSITLSAAIDLADSCQMAAIAMNGVLNAELVSLEDTEKLLGDKKVKKFKKDMEAAAKNGLFHRIKVKLLRRKCDTLNALAKKEMNKILAFTNIDKDGKVKSGKKVVDTASLSKGVAKNIDVVSDALGGSKETAEVAKNLALATINTKKAEYKLKKKGKDAAKITKDALHFVTGK